MYIYYSWFSVHSFNAHTLSIQNDTGSWGNRFQETPLRITFAQTYPHPILSLYYMNINLLCCQCVHLDGFSHTDRPGSARAEPPDTPSRGRDPGGRVRDYLRTLLPPRLRHGRRHGKVSQLHVPLPPLDRLLGLLREIFNIILNFSIYSRNRKLIQSQQAL